MLDFVDFYYGHGRVEWDMAFDNGKIPYRSGSYAGVPRQAPDSGRRP
jgi:hypothetical protein